MINIKLSTARWGNQTVSVFGGQKGQGSVLSLVPFGWSCSRRHPTDENTQERQWQPWGCGLQDVFNENFSHLAQLGPFQFVNKWVLRWFNESAEENFTIFQRWLWLCQRQRPPPASRTWWKKRSFGHFLSVASKAAPHFVQPFFTAGEEVVLFLSVQQTIFVTFINGLHRSTWPLKTKGWV